MKLAILFGSYRDPSNGSRLLPFLKAQAEAQGFEVSILDAKAIGLPMLDKKFEEFEEGKAPKNMADTSATLKAADAYIWVSGEYNASVQPGLKNLIDHFRTEYAHKPVGLCCYSPGVLGGARVSTHLRAIAGNLAMVSIPTVFGVGGIHEEINYEGELVGERVDDIKSQAEGFVSELKRYAEGLTK